ncbi:MAG: DUF4418 family protein [Eggerthellaceae bacterium]|nr:DUF4418 family protein [Eggerthellaceae bacterium]
MNKTAWSIVCVIGAVVMAAIAIVSAVMGGCDTMVELANGNSAPMKCHWTFVADTFIPIIGVAIALMAITCKDQSGRRAAAVGYIVTAIVAACMPASFGIGLCAMPEMHCHSTATIVWVLCAIAVVIGIVQVVKSNPAAADLPKRTI